MSATDTLGSVVVFIATHNRQLQEIAECLQQNAKSEKATAFLIWKALSFSVVALTTISEHLHHRIYFIVANILQSPVSSPSLSVMMSPQLTVGYSLALILNFNEALQRIASWLSLAKKCN